jgi:hypothetical protein
MTVIEHGCVICNQRGTIKVLDLYGRDTGKNRPCLVCDGSGEVVAATTYRGAVSALESIRPVIRAVLDGDLAVEALAAVEERIDLALPTTGGQ